MIKRAILVGVSILALAFITVSAAPVLRATWAPPTEGSPVDEYIVEVYGDDQLIDSYATQDTFFVLPQVDMFVEYKVRVAAQDALDRQGPWTDYSNTVTWDEGAPGSCGPVVLSEN